MLLFLMLAWQGLALAEDAWATEAAALRRWPAGTAPAGFVASVQAGQALEVLVREGAEVRVRAGSEFGWIDSRLLSAEPPAADEAPPIPTLELPSP